MMKGNEIRAYFEPLFLTWTPRPQFQLQCFFSLGFYMKPKNSHTKHWSIVSDRDRWCLSANGATCVYLWDVHLWDELWLDNLCNAPHTSHVHTCTTNTHIVYHSQALTVWYGGHVYLWEDGARVWLLSAGVQQENNWYHHCFLRQTEYTFTVIVLCVYIHSDSNRSWRLHPPVETLQFWIACMV